MAIELIEAGFLHSLGLDEDTQTMRTPFAPLLLDFGRNPANPKDALSLPGKPPTPAKLDAVLVINMIRPRIFDPARPLGVEAKFRYTGGDDRSPRVTVQDAEFGAATNQLLFEGPVGSVVTETFEFPNRPEKVGARTAKLEWTIVQTGSPTVTAETIHPLLITLGAPGEPWSLSQTEQDRWLWLDVLKVACDWAKCADSADEIVRRLTQKMYDLGGVDESRGLRYGVSNYCRGRNFDCAGFLRHVAGKGGSAYANCQDLATALSTFANALGCDLTQTQVGGCDPRGKSFSIGRNTFKTAFTFHEIAWSGAGGPGDLVADACLSTSKVDAMAPMPFRKYATQAFQAAPAILGQAFEENRLVNGPLLEIDRIVERRVRARHPELPLMAPDGEPFQHEWEPPGGVGAEQIAVGEHPWDLTAAAVHLARGVADKAVTAADAALPFAKEARERAAKALALLRETLPPAVVDAAGKLADPEQVTARVSVFETEEQARSYFFLTLDGVSEPLIHWTTAKGIALMPLGGTALYFKRANLVIVLRLRWGMADLRAQFDLVTGLLFQ